MELFQDGSYRSKLRLPSHQTCGTVLNALQLLNQKLGEPISRELQLSSLQVTKACTSDLESSMAESLHGAIWFSAFNTMTFGNFECGNFWE